MNPSRTAFHHALLSLLEAKDPALAIDVLDPLHAQGMFSLVEPVTHHGVTAPFIHHWIEGLQAHHLGWPAALLDRLDVWADGNDWWTLTSSLRGRRVQTTFDLWFAAAHRNLDTRLQAVFEHVPLAVLENWGTQEPGLQGPASPGAPLLAALFKGESLPREAQRALSEVAIDRGLSLTGQLGPSPLANQLTTAGHWERYLAQGGNPMRSLPRHKDYPEAPEVLYLSLLAKGKAGLTDAIRAWSETSPEAQSTLSAQDLERYWRKVGQSGMTTAVLTAVRTQENWPALRTAGGLNVLMHVLAHQGDQGSARNAVEQLGNLKKALPLHTAVDKEGRNLWYYALHRTSVSAPHANSSLLLWLKGAGVPLQTDAHGRGFLLQGMAPTEGTRREKNDVLPVDFYLFKLDWSNPKIKALLAHPHLWLAGTAAEQAQAQAALQSRPLSEKSDSLVQLAGALLDSGEPLDRAWSSVFLLEVLRAQPHAWEALAERLLDNGAMLPKDGQDWPVALKAHLGQLTTEGAVDRIWAQSQANARMMAEVQRQQAHIHTVAAQVTAPARSSPRPGRRG